MNPSAKKFFKFLPIGLPLLVILLLTGFFGYQWYSNYQMLHPKNPLNKVLAIVGDKKITQRDLNTEIYGLGFVGSIENPESISDDTRKQILEQLIENEIITANTKRLGISVSEEEIINKTKANNLKLYNQISDSQKALMKNTAKFQLLKERLLDKILAWSEGKFIIVRFDLHFYGPPTDLSEEARKNLLPQDKSYAQELINKTYQDIKTGKITFEEGMEIASQDPKLGIKAWEPWKMTYSQAFTKEHSVNKEFPESTPDFWNEVAKVPVGEISNILAIKKIIGEEKSLAGQAGDIVEAFYMIVKKEKGNQGETSSYEEWLQKQKDTLKVKIFL